MLLDPVVVARQPLTVVAVVAVILLVKAIVCGGAVLVLGVPYRIALIAALSLAQIGEFSFVLSQAGLKYALLTPELYQIFLAASIATMGLTPLLIRLAPALADRSAALLPKAVLRGRGSLARGEKKLRLAGHVIIVGYGFNGRNLAKVLRHLKIPHAVIETNPFTVAAEKKRGQRIVFGDASNQEILSHAQVETARAVVIAISDAAASRRIAAQVRALSPTVRVIVRTRYIAEVEPLYKLGANEVIPEEFETSIEILARVLRTFLVSQDDIEHCVADVRRDGYEMLRGISRRHSHAVGIGSYLTGAEIANFKVRAGSLLEGESLREGTLRSRSGASILAIKRGEEMVANPDPVWELHEGDLALVLGTPEQLAAAGRLFESAHGTAETDHTE
jgi:CPA2 family monovalent cation:H+ antiporter-2